MPARSGASSGSMHTTASSFTSSWIESSPSRQSPVRNVGRTPTRERTMDVESPSQRMILEFRQMQIRSDEEFANKLDEASAEHAQLYQAQLNKAASEHQKVRAEAELERQRIIEEHEAEQRRRNAELQRDLDRMAQEKAKEEAERLKREAEARKREEEAARQAAEHQRQLKEAEDRQKAQQEQEEAARREQLQKEEDAKKAKAASDAAAIKARAQAAMQGAQPAAPVAPTAPAAQPAASTAAPQGPTAQAAQAVGPSAAVEEIHSRYLELHQRMKAFWKPFKNECSQKGHPLKEAVGDMRRGITRTAGQATTKREDSKAVITTLREIFRKARAVGGPTIDIRQFIISHPIPQISDESQAQYPAILLYAFICFEKSVIKQFDQEAASDDGRIITEIGAIAASLFCDKEFIWNGIPLSDIMLAKLHRACPILFGIRGNLKSVEGKRRLGCIQSGQELSLNTYHQRMQGIGAGFAAMSVRGTATPAIPMSEYWRAVSRLCNTPSDDLHSGHFYMLKGLLRDAATKVVAYYGVQGKALLRQAAMVVPKRAPPRAKEVASIVEVLPETWKAKRLMIE